MVVPCVGVKNLDSFTLVVLFKTELSDSSIIFETADARYWELNVCNELELYDCKAVVIKPFMSDAPSVVAEELKE